MLNSNTIPEPQQNNILEVVNTGEPEKNNQNQETQETNKSSNNENSENITESSNSNTTKKISL
jgi:hypothetical protein